MFAKQQAKLRSKQSQRKRRPEPRDDEPRQGEEVAVSAGKGWKRVQIDPSMYEGDNQFGGLVELEELAGDEAAAFASGLTAERLEGDGDEDGGDDGDGNEEAASSGDDSSDDDDDDVPALEDTAPPFVAPDSMSAWAQYGLHHSILHGLFDLGFLTPTPVQCAALTAALTRGNDVIGAAETGSGKTLAFALPILQALVTGDNGRVTLKGPYAIVLCPTRELAMQVRSMIKAAAKYCREKKSGLPVAVVSVVGGMSEQKQLRLLARRPAIVVGTPGRLWEFMTRKQPAGAAAESKYAAGETFLGNMQHVHFLVVDEADAMTKTGRFKEVEQVLKQLPVLKGSARDIQLDDEQQEAGRAEDRWWRKRVGGAEAEQEEPPSATADGRALTERKRTTFLFSATLAIAEDAKRNLRKWKKQHGANALKSNTMERILALMDFHKHIDVLDLTDPEKERAKAQAAAEAKAKAVRLAEGVWESHITVNVDEKDALLYAFLRRFNHGRTLVFCNTVTGVKRLVPLLKNCNIEVHGLHAAMQQRQRLKNLDRFRTNERSILVATDVAARGLDIPNVAHVIHFDVPMNVELYIHRSGRTGRAGQEGVSVMFVTAKDGLAFDRMKYMWEPSGGLPRFPIELGLLPLARDIVKVAKKIDVILHTAKKRGHEKSFSTLVLGAAGAQEEEQAAEDDDEDPQDGEAALDKYKRAELDLLRQEMDELIARPFLPKGMSSRYPTKTPEVLAMLSAAPTALEELKRRHGGKKGRKANGAEQETAKLRKQREKKERRKKRRAEAAQGKEQGGGEQTSPNAKKPKAADGAAPTEADLEHKREIRRKRKANKRRAKGVARAQSGGGE